MKQIKILSVVLSLLLFPYLSNADSQENDAATIISRINKENLSHLPIDNEADYFSEAMRWGFHEGYYVTFKNKLIEDVEKYQDKHKFPPEMLSGLLKCNYPPSQAFGVYLAVRQDEKSLAPEVMKLLSHKAYYVKYNALKALRKLNPDIKPRFFIKILQNPEEDVYARAAAISVLFPWIKQDIYPYIKNLAGISKPMDYWIARSIGELKIIDGYTVLMETLCSEDYEVIKAALESFELISGTEVLTERIEYTPRMVEDPVYSEDAIVCTDLDDEIWLRGSIATKEYFRKYGTKKIIAALTHKNYKVRRMTVLIIERELADNFIPQLLKLAVDKNWRVCIHAIRALEKTKSDKSYQVVIRQMRNSNKIIKQSAYRSAAFHGHRQYYDHFISGLEENDDRIRWASVEGLSKINNPEAIPMLRRAFTVESYFELRIHIWKCLDKLSWKPETRREVLFNKIFAMKFDEKDFLNMDSIRLMAKFHEHRNSGYQVLKNDILEKIQKVYEGNKDICLYLAENFNQLNAEQQYLIYSHLAGETGYAVIPILMDYFLQDEWTKSSDIEVEEDLKRFLDSPYLDSQVLKKIWPGVVAESKTPRDFKKLTKKYYARALLNNHLMELDHYFGLYKNT